MPQYQAPLRDTRFVLEEVLQAEDHLRRIGRGDLGLDDINAIIGEAAKLTETVIHPVNQSTDHEGCHFDNGRVRVPQGIKDAYRAYVDGGWLGLGAPEDHGGQNLPDLVAIAVQEIVNSGGISFGDYVGIFSQAYRLLRAHASPELLDRYGEDLVGGRLGATMCMTEPHCGTDVGLLRTRAEPAADGTYRITGTKIFISAGEHDLTANILHLVLARIVGAPVGSKGVSLFAVPKFLPGTGHALGARNGVQATSLEHKMGYCASATCQMSFDGATGWLIGEPNRGLSMMFTMINLARLAVAGQGLSTADIAYQNAAAYAKDRLQGRAPSGIKAPDKVADPIVEHPDVRRMLLATRSFVEAGRAIYLWMGAQIDLAAHATSESARSEAAEWLSLMTPVVKSTLSDYGFESCNHCMQIFGGHGYIRDTGVEQYVRDVRLSQIQEGANGMLALDLIRRHVLKDGGRSYRRFVAEVKRSADTLETTDATMARQLLRAVATLERATQWIEEQAASNPDEVGAAGTEYQRIFGLVLMGWFWARMATLAGRHAPDDDGGFYADKLRTARFYMARMLPMAAGHLEVLEAGGQTLLEPSASYF